ncbi:MAG: NAD-dependent epimerase/dehydratase family protein [Gemmataceae bacterium]|nr:NAD-dependent epimerase/dehydratase family protein [Gemmataceae bacterium]
MTAVVTGGGGFLGGAVVRLLRRRGRAVRSFTRTAYPWLDELGVEQSLGDLSDPAAVERAVAGAGVVFHVAAKAGVWGRRADYVATNVTGTENVLAACKKHGVRKLVYTSTPSVVHGGGDLEGADESAPYPKHFEADYPETKAVAEKAVLAADGPELATVALRPHLIYGPGDPHLIPRVLERARAGKLRRVGTRPVKVDVTYIDNAADAHLLAADRLDIGSPAAGKPYFISDGRPVDLWEFINAVLAEAGLPPVARAVSAWKARLAGRVLETAHRWLWLPGEPAMTRFVAGQLAASHWYDISAARRDLGYDPKVSTDEGLRRLGEALRGGGKV